jgi:hypothetical protein
MGARLAFVLLMASVSSTPVSAQTSREFRFESIASLDEMSRFFEQHLPIGTPREALRGTFVDQGKASMKVHPGRAGVEKYLYDINLCGYYVWRWNISADFDAGGRLVQGYVNGEPVFAAGPQKKDVKDFEKGHQAMYKVSRPRPEASKGESQLSFILFDADSNTSTIDDELAIGGGPSRADPARMGQVHVYSSVDPWRSIFDKDDAERIVTYAGSCKEADDLYAKQRAASQGH